MTTIATDLQKTECRTSATFTCGKVRAYVARYDYSGDVSWRVCVMNSSHATWRKAGRHFATHEAAVAGYKSGAVKAILSAARDMLSP